MNIPMRRKKQKLSPEKSIELLNSGVFGVLGTAGTDGYPYAVPVSYAYAPGDSNDGSDFGRIFIHCAPEGHKLDALRQEPRVSFTVVTESKTWAEKLTALFRSVIVFGRAREAANDAEKREALVALGRKYSPGMDDLTEGEINKLWKRTMVIVIDADEISGKEAIELVENG